MPYRGIVFGYIDLPKIHFNHNRNVFKGLPELDPFPGICPSMFSPMESHPIDDDGRRFVSYEGEVIAFAAAYKLGVGDEEIQEWINKFEDLLDKLYWQEAVVKAPEWGLSSFEIHYKQKSRNTLGLQSGGWSRRFIWHDEEGDPNQLLEGYGMPPVRRHPA